MNFSNFLLKVLGSLAILFMINACVEDDDFDSPSAEQLEEIISVGADNISFFSCLEEDFESFNDEQEVFPQYENLTTRNSVLWQIDEFDNNQYLRMSAFNQDGFTDSYFVIPVNFDEADEFSFTTQDRFWNGNPLNVWVVTNYSVEDNILDADLEEITSEFNIAEGNTEAFTNDPVFSGVYDLSNQSGNGFIAFHYEGNGSGGFTTTIHIDDIKIVDSEDTDCDVVSDTTRQGGEDDTPITCLSEDFESYNESFQAFPMYENVTQLGTRFWEVDEFDGNKYLELSAFAGSTNPPVDIISYIAIPVNFDEAEIFRFETQDRFNNGEVLTVYTTTDYTFGDDINGATLTDITSNFTIASGTTGGASQPFVQSGDFDLTPLTGTGHIIFEYSSSGGSISTTMHIDNIQIVDTDDMDCENSGGGGGGNSQGGGSAMFESCDTEDFEMYAEDQEDFPEYENISTDTGRFWEINEFSGNQYLRLSGFAGTGNPIPDFTSYFVVSVNFDQADIFRFKTQDRFSNGDPLTVFSTTDYTIGNDITAATLTDITSNFTIATGNTESATQPFVESGDFDLSGLSGNGHIVFVYESGGSVSTTMHIDDIEIIDSDDPSCGSGGGANPTTILISELADPDNNATARFVEIWNYGTETVDLTGWSLQRWTNGNADVTGSSRIDLVGTIAPGDAYVVAHDEPEFTTVYGFAPDLASSNSASDSNGDDQIGLFNPDGELHDIFGVPGEDGTGTNHEFEDGRARRKATVMMENATYDFAEWDVWNDSGDAGTMNDPQQAPDDFTPGVHPDGGGGGTGAISLDVFFSEYVEGSGQNKYLEIYNPSSETIDLSRYQIRNSRNDESDWSLPRDLQLSGTLEPNSTFVITINAADMTITDAADLVLDSSVDNPIRYNGDDAVGLFVDSNDDGAFDMMLDIIGVIDNDPGAGWDVAGVAAATQNHSLIRKSTIATGNTDWNSSAGTNTTDSEWIVNDEDDFSSIGVR